MNDLFPQSIEGGMLIIVDSAKKRYVHNRKEQWRGGRGGGAGAGARASPQ